MKGLRQVLSCRGPSNVDDTLMRERNLIHVNFTVGKFRLFAGSSIE
jgi:hypothetical protein